ncbi:hypothetical protein QJS04_geneDACA004470 [Acorus gramineus]|uniref:Uncharacterized protein n=1 Tax=Acorus gramineus TaxID=55184 RepID=A0AAV9B4I1_ACOGR|nr:hypothetical protein QJS04_geneDACA004470 [Acorus gramineus]
MATSRAATSGVVKGRRTEKGQGSQSSWFPQDGRYERGETSKQAKEEDKGKAPVLLTSQGVARCLGRTKAGRRCRPIGDDRRLPDSQL